MAKHQQWLKAAVRDTDDLKLAFQSVPFVSSTCGLYKVGL